MPGKRAILSGFGGVPAHETELHRPERLETLAALSRSEVPRIPRGLGRAYGDAAVLAGGRTVLLTRLDRLIAVDPEACLLEAEGGARLDRALEVLVPRGLFPVVVPGTAQVTLAGMVAADVHGKNHHRDGAVSAHLDALGLLLADGRRRTLSRRRSGRLFFATCGGMGLTGFIEWVRLRLLRIPSAYLSVDVERSADLETSLRAFAEEDHRYRYSVAWIDCMARGRAMGRGVLMRGDWLSVEDLPPGQRRDPYGLPRGLPTPRVPWTPPFGLVRPWSIRAFNEAFFRLHPRRALGVVQDYRSFFFPLDAVEGWNRLYGPSGFQQYQCVLPEAEAVAGLTRLLERLSAAGAGSFLAVLKRMGEGEPRAPLSFPRPGVILALDLPHRGEETLALLDALDRIVLAHGGRLYLAKDARMRPETFREMYPELPAFREIKAKVDPMGRFVSSLARRLEILP